MRLPIIVCLAAAACGDGSGRRFELGGGAAVQVSSTGAVQIAAAGRIVMTIPPEGVSVRTFDESFTAPLGIWEFERAGVDTASLRFESVTDFDDAIQVRYRSGDRSATMTVRAGDGPLSIQIAASGPATSIAVPLRCDPEASFFGFGGQYNGGDQRGEAFELFVSEQGIGRTGGPFAITGGAHTTYFPMPYWVDHRGFGVLVETTRRVNVDLCASNPELAWIEVIDSRPLSMVILPGPTPLDVIDQLGAHVGRPALPPDWAFGLWIAAQGGPAEVMAVADALDSAGIDASALWVQDWTGRRRNADGGFGVQYRWAADPDFYPDLAELVAAIHARGMRFLGYANPFVDPELDDHFAEMDAAGLLIGDPEGGSYRFLAPNGRASMPDLTRPEARAYVRDALGAMVTELGFDGWMSDFGEWLPLDAVLADGTSALDYHNRYPIEWHRIWREVMDELRPDGDYAVFARSGFTGVHRFAQIYWIGDQETSFSATDGLPTVVPAMLNLGLSGIPYVTHDIAGFTSLEGPSTKELYLRWTELGAFTPTMRTHEGSARDDNWSWDADAETTAHFRRFARIHAALQPEIVVLAAEAKQTSAPIVRHLMLEHPDDPIARTVDDQFLLGRDLLVAPVLAEGATERQVYLPDGVWFDVWTGERFEGRQTIVVAAPIGRPPVFSRGADRSDLRAIAGE